MDYFVQNKDSLFLPVQRLLGATKTELNQDRNKPLSEQMKTLNTWVQDETGQNWNNVSKILGSAGATALFSLATMWQSNLGFKNSLLFAMSTPALTWNCGRLSHATFLLLIAFGPSSICPLCDLQELLSYCTAFAVFVYLVSLIYCDQ